MQLSAEQTQQLKAYLQQSLQKITDADTSILSDYILALLKNDASPEELRVKCSSGLEDFLLESTGEFVQALFGELSRNYGLARTQSLEATAAATALAVPTSSAAPFPASGQATAAAASHQRSPSRSPRKQQQQQGPPPSADRNDDRYEDARPRSSREERPPRNRSASPPPARGEDRRAPAAAASHYERDRDYRDRDRNNFERSRRYDDREPPRVPRDRMDYRGGPEDPKWGRHSAGSGSGPVRPHRRRGPCYDYEEKGYCTRGDACPFEHGADRIVSSGPIADMVMQQQHQPFPPRRDMDRRGGSFPGRFRSGGGSGGSRSGGEPVQKIGVTQIPDEYYTQEQISEYFSRFGTITNVHLRPHDRKAFITFSSVAEAQRAVEDPGAPFNNRFVRIYYDYYVPNAAGGDGFGMDVDMNTSSSPAFGAPPQQPKIEFTPEERARRQEEAQRIRENLHKQMQELQKKQDEERRRLIEKMGQMNPEERDAIMKSLTSVTQTIAATPGVLAKTSKQTALPQRSSAPDFSASAVYKKQQLDRELDQITSASQEDTAMGEAGTETAEELRQRLEAVKAEHAALTATPSYRGRGMPRGGMTPRGGRGAFRGGRGGLRGMSLDLRPRKFAVRGFPLEAVGGSLHAHFQQFLGMQTLEMAEDLQSATVTYGTRWQAEAAFQKGLRLADGTQLQFAWVTDGTSPAATPAPMFAVSEQSSITGDAESYVEEDEEGAAPERSWKR